MRTKVQVDEIRCDRCDAPTRDDMDHAQAERVFGDLRSTFGSLTQELTMDPDDVDLCAKCDKRVRELVHQILTPRTRANAST